MDLDFVFFCALASAGGALIAAWLFEAALSRELRGSALTVLAVRDPSLPLPELLRAASGSALCERIIAVDMCGGIASADLLVRDGLCLAVCQPEELPGLLRSLDG